MTARPLPHHLVPPGLLMVFRRDEVTELAEANDHRPLSLRMAIEQWRFNVATREAILDAGGRPVSGGWLVHVADRGTHDSWEASHRWHFPQEPRRCPDEGACHHDCSPVAGCWRVTRCAPLSGYCETWPLAVRIAHEHTDGLL